MNKGLYSACSAMLVQEAHLDVVSNNLANVDTAGFRRRVPVNAEFSSLMDRVEKVSEDQETKITTVNPFNMNWKGKQTLGSLALANVFSESHMDTHPGVVRVTENPLDLLIKGDGFFSVQDGAGNTFYTREGDFQLSAEGVIVTHDGMPLQGDGGEIAVGNAQKLHISETGQVFADGEPIGNIPLFIFDNPTYLRQVGKNLLAVSDDSGAPQGVESVRLLSGALEMSNVSVVEEMVRMIEAQRAYEGASKALMTHDEMTGKLISAYGKA